MGWLEKGEGMVVGGMHTKGKFMLGAVSGVQGGELDFDIEVPCDII